MDVNMIAIALLFVVLPPTLAQYSISNGMRPDVRFDEDNDRYDVTNIVIDQNMQFPEPRKEDTRRLNRKYSFRRKDVSSDQSSIENEPYISDFKTSNNVKKQFVPILKFEKSQNGYTGDFAYHDKMENGDYENDFEKNLEPFKMRRSVDRLVDILHGGEVGGRRNMAAVNPEDEILFHHAVPVKITIDGFLVPENGRR